MTIVMHDTEKLRVKSKPITNESEAFIIEVKNKLISHLEHLKGFGLVAIQIGIPLRIFVIRINNEFITFVNPEVIDQYDERIVKNEGCFSFPEQYITTKRFNYITVKNVDGKIRTFDGMLAVAMQHEIDHLDGILFFDHKFTGERAKKKPKRNDSCLCGSGKKYKRCCMLKEKII